MRKYRSPLTEDEKNELERLSKLTFDNWSEADVREEFIVPLLIILGYRKDLDYSVSREDSYKLNPFFLQVGRNRIKLDYLCSVRKQKFWIIESKPGGTITNGNIPSISEEDIAQAHFYTLHPSIDAKFFVVTNGWHINLYDRDSINEKMEPIISIKNTELIEKFVQLDSYIGATQLLYTLKKKLLKDIETTLSAEVHLDRLDEFLDAVRSSVSNIRPKVLDNFRKNARVQEEYIDKTFKEIISGEDLDFIVSSVFINSMSMKSMRDATKIVAERYMKEYSSRQFLFFNKLALEETRAVRIPYYYNVLEFLIQLKRENITGVVYKDKNIDEVINYWVELCLFHFWDRKDLRYLWMFEGLLGRMAIRLLFLTGEARKAIIRNNEFEIYMLPEETIAWMGPNPARDVIRIINSIIDVSLNKIVSKFMIDGNIKEKLLNDELNKLIKFVDTLEKNTEEDYLSIRNELGSSWGELEYFSYINNYFDKLSSGICDVLLYNPDILNNLPYKVKQRIALQASLGNVNFADKCFKSFQEEIYLNIKIDKDKLLNQYYDTDVNPYMVQLGEGE